MLDRAPQSDLVGHLDGRGAVMAARSKDDKLEDRFSS